MRPLHIRVSRNRDLEEILQIEELSFEKPLDIDELKRELKQSPFWVIEDEDRIYGYMILQAFKGGYYLVRLAVHNKFRREGIGTALLKFIKSKIANGTRITAVINADHLLCLGWLRKNGFRAVRRVEDLSAESGESYVMVYSEGEKIIYFGHNRFGAIKVSDGSKIP